MLYVWNIFLHLGNCWGECRYIFTYIHYMEHLGKTWTIKEPMCAMTLRISPWRDFRVSRPGPCMTSVTWKFGAVGTVPSPKPPFNAFQYVLRLCLANLDDLWVLHILGYFHIPYLYVWNRYSNYVCQLRHFGGCTLQWKAG